MQNVSPILGKTQHKNLYLLKIEILKRKESFQVCILQTKDGEGVG